jgi:hypothetical protein
MARKNSVWGNYGDGIQVYDLLFEVDKLDSFARTDGKASDKYKKQHEKTVNMITSYNSQTKTSFPLSLSRSRSIIRGPRFMEDTVFYNDGKKVAGNKGQESENDK